MHVKIITPEATVFEAADVRHVLLPAENGEIGILSDHIATVCSLMVGRIRIDLPDDTVELATSGGFAEVLDDDISILAETAERAGDIDVERARKAMKRAREQLARRGELMDEAAAGAALARAINRLRIADQG